MRSFQGRVKGFKGEVDVFLRRSNLGYRIRRARVERDVATAHRPELGKVIQGQKGTRKVTNHKEGDRMLKKDKSRDKRSRWKVTECGRRIRNMMKCQ